MRLNFLIKHFSNLITLILFLTINPAYSSSDKSDNLNSTYSSFSSSQRKNGVTIEEVDDEIFLSSSSVQAEEINMPFKVGFEFQEATHLCRWAEDDFEIQKKKLFEIFDISTKRALWHLVIDSTDIECVTEPFSHTEEIF